MTFQKAAFPNSSLSSRFLFDFKPDTVALQRCRHDNCRAFAGTAAMSGVNIGSQATMIITNVVFGLCVGGTVLIGQYLGAGNRQAIREVIGTLFTGLFILAGIITTVMLILTDPVLYLIKTPAESFAYAKSYFTITMLGTVFIFGYNALAAIMRGLGDSKNPLYFVAIACFTNIVLDLLLVAVIPPRAAGAAVATLYRRR